MNGQENIETNLKIILPEDKTKIVITNIKINKIKFK
jgi:hypothetical protein